MSRIQSANDDRALESPARAMRDETVEAAKQGGFATAGGAAQQNDLARLDGRGHGA